MEENSPSSSEEKALRFTYRLLPKEVEVKETEIQVPKASVPEKVYSPLPTEDKEFQVPKAIPEKVYSYSPLPTDAHAAVNSLPFTQPIAANFYYPPAAFYHHLYHPSQVISTTPRPVKRYFTKAPKGFQCAT